MENIYELSKLVSRQKATLDTLIPEKELSPLKRLAALAFSKDKLY
jgi:hypothetical protein